jgi:hypothetical protein
MSVKHDVKCDYDSIPGYRRQLRDDSWCVKGAHAWSKDDCRLGVVTSDADLEDPDCKVAIEWADGDCDYINVSNLRCVKISLTGAGSNMLIGKLENWKIGMLIGKLDNWEGAYASHESKVGRVTMNPDPDNEVKLKWADGDTSGYIKVHALCRATEREFDAAKPKPKPEQSGGGGGGGGGRGDGRGGGNKMSKMVVCTQCGGWVNRAGCPHQ